MLKSLYSPTQRIPPDDEIDDDAVEELRNVMGELSDLRAWCNAEKHLKLGEKPELLHEWSSADELHGTFRMFCKYGRIDVVRELLAGHESEFWIRNGSAELNETGLVVAAKYGQLKMCKLLVKNAAEIDHMADGGDALTWCCRSLGSFPHLEAHFVETAEFLLKQGAPHEQSIDTPKYNKTVGPTPLHYAVQNQSVLMVQMLRRYNAIPYQSIREAALAIEGDVGASIVAALGPS